MGKPIDSIELHLLSEVGIQLRNPYQDVWLEYIEYIDEIEPKPKISERHLESETRYNQKDKSYH